MQTKTLTFFFCLCSLAFFQEQLIAQTAPQQDEAWNTLKDSLYSIQYPQDWELSQSGQMGTSFILLSKASSPKDQFRENVNFLIQDIAGYNLTLDQYVELTINQVKTMIENGNLLLSERVEKGDNSYHKVIYTGKQNIYELKFEQYFWLKNDKAYILTLTCEEKEFDTYQEIGEKIMDSFVWHQ